MKLKIVCSNIIVASSVTFAIANAPKHLVGNYTQNGCEIIAETKNLGTQLHLSTHILKFVDERFGTLTFYEP